MGQEMNPVEKWRKNMKDRQKEKQKQKRKLGEQYAKDRPEEE